jgi:guanylate kinase
MIKRGKLYIVSAPSGAGKTSLLKALTAKIESISTSISTTTRPKRSGEVEGTDYYFVSVEEFSSMIEQGDFLEHAEVFGNFYGTSKTYLTDVLESGQNLVLEIDWQGAQQIRKQLPDAVSIFILPPSKEELARRLKRRAQDNEQVINDRMASAIEEISHYDEYDFIVMNDEFELALADLESIILTNKLSQPRESAQYEKLITELL